MRASAASSAKFRLFGESRDLKIRAVHAQQQPGLFIDRALVVLHPGAVGRAYFPQGGVRLGHDVGDTERSADLDQLSARDDDFSALRQRIQRQQDRGRIIVYDDGGDAGRQLTLGLTNRRALLARTAGGGCPHVFIQQLAEQSVHVHVALAALPGFDIELQIRISRGSVANVFQSGSCQRGASQVGVEDDAGRIDDRTQRVAQRLPDLARDRVRDSREGEVNGGRIQSPRRNLGAQTGQYGASGVGNGGVAFAGNDRGQSGAVQQLIDGRKLAVKLGFRSCWHRDDYPMSGVGPQTRASGLGPQTSDLPACFEGRVAAQPRWCRHRH